LKPQQGQHVITADISEIQLTLSLVHHLHGVVYMQQITA